MITQLKKYYNKSKGVRNLFHIEYQHFGMDQTVKFLVWVDIRLIYFEKFDLWYATKQYKISRYCP